MTSRLKHRGPDNQGTRVLDLAGGRRLGLGHTRLAILDLSSAGHQPMEDPETGSWIVFNGEIYNHRDLRRHLPLDKPFRSTSDTETILRGWAAHGSAFLTSLRGMFAFALYDHPRREFWLARDRLGVKPLYAAQAKGGSWIFASEVRALLAADLLPRRLDPSALESYLAYGAVSAPWTMIRGVESLAPGECWCFSLDTGELFPRRERYWSLCHRPGDPAPQSRPQAVERIAPLVREAIGLRMLADVPVGVFLSGGIDSSSIVATLAHQGRCVHTFSVTFGESDYDESAHSAAVAKAFATEHVALHVRPEQVLDSFTEALAAYDQPSIDGVNTYFISRAVRQAGLKVALSGLGGDELFAGYSYFRLANRLERVWGRELGRLYYLGRRLLAPAAMSTQKMGAFLRSSHSRLERFACLREVMLVDRRRQIVQNSSANGHVPLPPSVLEDLGPALEELDPVNAFSLFDTSLYLANMLLRDTDQMSMAHALEVREPLLDHVLAETMLAIPGRLKLEGGAANGLKALLVDSLPCPLPPGILNRPKMGFVFPWERWLRNELKGQVEDRLFERSIVEAAGLSLDGIKQLWMGFLAGKPGIRYTDIFCLVNLLDWVRRQGMSLYG